LALLDHPFTDNKYTSALISGMAVLGISQRCGWESALTYTPKIAAIINISRMLVLYQAIKMRKERAADIQ
ncbi:uncharacterized protein BDZ99DRAFT_403588, partial [Mytilinidion resinicola]